MNKLKALILLASGTVGTVLIQLFGGADAVFVTLITFMIADFVTGLIVAAVFKSSTKTGSGRLSSKAGLKGICKKIMILVFVLISVRMDMTLGTDYIRECVITAFIVNELISLVENAGLMGVPIPGIILNAIDVLKNKQDSKDGIIEK